ncbi:MAG: ABC transporter ATP-binding protein [Candidatus Heimdallarchaeota archaeon]|nr:ABC transporter ATP-binding protein [Candidatus Heimdallarchaeota archaeon]
MNTGLETRGIKKYFSDIVALDDINLKLDKGAIVGLLGPNGAGKSTLVRLLSGVMRPTSGEAYIYGYDLQKNIDDIKRITGLLPEEHALYEKLSVYEYIEFIGTLYDLDRTLIEIKFATLSEVLNLNLLRDRLIETLSKGQKQKVAILSALIHDPKILFLDEPLANLDIRAQKIVRDLIKKFKDESKIIMIATHLLSNIETICDYLVVINRGIIVFQGTIEAFKGSFENLEDAYLNMVDLV